MFLTNYIKLTKANPKELYSSNFPANIIVADTEKVIIRIKRYFFLNC